MRIASWCADCIRATPDGVGREDQKIFVAFTTNPVALMRCPKGHNSVLILGDGAHSLLFERAISRLVEGRTRDAITDAHTALEMYIANVPARARYDREKGASPRAIREELKRSTKTSERAHGAALAIASLVSGAEPPSLPESVATVRNAAIHQGAYPTVAQAERAIVEIDAFVRDMERILSSVPCANEMIYWQMMHHEQIVETLQRMKGTPGWAPTSITHTYLLTTLSTAAPSPTAPAAILAYRDKAGRGDFVADVR